MPLNAPVHLQISSYGALYNGENALMPSPFQKRSVHACNLSDINNMHNESGVKKVKFKTLVLVNKTILGLRKTYDVKYEVLHGNGMHCF